MTYQTALSESESYLSMLSFPSLILRTDNNQMEVTVLLSIVATEGQTCRPNAQVTFIALSEFLVCLFTLCFKRGRYHDCGPRVTSKSHYHTTVQPEVTLREIPPGSDSGPRMEVNRIEQT